MRAMFRTMLTAVLVTTLSLFAAGGQAQTTDTTTAPAATTTTTESSGVVADATALVTSHTDVSVGAYVLRLSNVSPQNGTFDVDMWLWFRWKGSDVRPDQSFEIVNGVISSRSEATVVDDGGVNYSQIHVLATIFHDFDVRRFPLDNHVITIELEDANLDDAQLTYTVDEGVALDPSVRVSGWKVAMQPTAVATHVYATNYGLRSAGADASKYSRLTFAVSLDRTSYGPLFKSFWISALAVLLGLLAFLIKSDDLDARFGMGVGSIFAASANAFVITGNLPPTTAVTLAEQINLIAVGVIFIAVFLSIFSLRLRYKDREEASLALDWYAMWTLGVIYLILNILALMFDFSGRQRLMLIGIDWGGTKIEGVAMEPGGREILRLRQDTPRHDYQGCLKAVKAMIDRLEAETGQTGSIGIGIPGSLEPVSRLGKGASSTWLLGQPVEADLQAVIQRPIRVENDADCLAASEATDGAGKGYNVVFAVILGSGAGAGIAVAGRAHHGPNNSGGEWGHNPLPFPDTTEIPGLPCYCGRHGCMETWVSGRAFEGQYALHTGQDLKAWQIMELKRKGDRLAGMLWDRYIDRVARGLATVVNTLDPDVFVMGGGMSNVDELYEDLPRALAKRTFSTVFHTPILRNVHGDASGVRGAAWLWKD